MSIDVVYESKPVELTDDVLLAIIRMSNRYGNPHHHLEDIRQAAGGVNKGKIISASIKCDSEGYVHPLKEIVAYHDGIKLVSKQDHHVVIPKGCIKDVYDLLNKIADQIEGK